MGSCRVHFPGKEEGWVASCWCQIHVTSALHQSHSAAHLYSEEPLKDATVLDSHSLLASVLRTLVSYRMSHTRIGYVAIILHIEQFDDRDTATSLRARTIVPGCWNIASRTPSSSLIDSGSERVKALCWHRFAVICKRWASSFSARVFPWNHCLQIAQQGCQIE
jgi:hypothetical protein